MRRLSKLAMVLTVSCMLLALTGCLSQIIPERAPPPQSYDFGPLPEERPVPLPLRVELAAVEAPSWLDSRDIRYRRLDEHPQALRAYARSQWIAAVPELFAQRFRQRLAQAAPAERRGELVLRLEIVSFEHVFTEADEAHVMLHARARLDDTNGSVREREISLQRPATPDARGATAELPALVDAAIDDVLAWLREVADPSQ